MCTVREITEIDRLEALKDKRPKIRIVSTHWFNGSALIILVRDSNKMKYLWKNNDCEDNGKVVFECINYFENKGFNVLLR